MKKFKHRLKYYLIGFGLGLTLMFFLFGNRACSWLPENRVKNMIAEKEIIVGDSLGYLMECQGVTNDDVYRFLKDDGDVDFSNSQTKKEPKEYLFEGKKGNKELKIRFALYDEQAEVIGFEFSQKNCETNLSNDNKRVVPLPDSEVREIIGDKELRVLALADCQLDCFGLTKDQVEVFYLDATVVMDESEPRLQPNPFYVMKGKMDRKEYKVTYIIGENRTRVSYIESIGQSCNCE